jgi:hypothetical protein
MQKIILILILATSFNAYSYVDLNLSYTFSERRIEATDTSGNSNPDLGVAISTTRGVTANWAWYIWEYTAIEFNYSETDQILEDNRQVVDSASGITIKKVNSLVKTVVQGAGIRQSFANRKSAIVPSVSIGYAKLITSGDTRYTLSQAGTDYEVSLLRDKEVFNSGYASFSLAFRITQLVRLTLMAKTVVPDFKTEEAKNNLTYSGGLSWMF